jgi:hypothetical protein
MFFGQKRRSNYQHYNILSAYEIKDKTSTSSTYVSLVFYRTIRSMVVTLDVFRENRVQKTFVGCSHFRTHVHNGRLPSGVVDGMPSGERPQVTRTSDASTSASNGRLDAGQP